MQKTETAIHEAPEHSPANGTARSFVGRGHQLQEMRAALESALSGSGRLILLSGEAGIGKTRLAEELARDAQGRGFSVVWGRCWEGGGAPPYWPWVQILRNVVHHLDSDWLASTGLAARYIAEMIPELRLGLATLASSQSAPSLPSLPAVEDRPEQARFQLFDSISTLLRHAAAANPLLLIMDDLHNADPDSLLLLRFLARDLPHARILIIGTYREIEVRHSPQHSTLLGDIIREANCFPLRGLDNKEVAELVRGGLGFSPDRQLLESLTTTTEGNPFFLDEIVRLMKAEGRLPSPNAPRSQFNIPDGIRAAVRRRLAPLSEHAHAALSVAAVIGHEFEFSVLLHVSDLDEERLGEVLEQAIALGLVVEAGGSVHHRFTHAIIPEVLRTDLSRKRLLELHQQIAGAIERLHRAELDTHAAAIALHYEQVLAANERGGGGNLLSRSRLKIANYARRGADRSMKQIAYSEAARLYQMALQAIGTSRTNHRARAELLFCLGEALRKQGSWSEAKQAFAQALTLARKLGDAGLLARAALASCGWSATLFGAKVDPEVVALLEEALSAIGESDSAAHANLMARLAQELAAEHRERSLELCEDALRIARRIDDPGATLSALWTRYQLYWGPHDVEKRLDTAAEIIRLAEKADALEWALSAHEFRLSALIELGRFDLADREIERYAALQERARQSSGTIERYRAMRCVMRGEFEQAERYALEGLQIAARRGDQPLAAAFGVVMIKIRSELGRAAENEHFISDYAAQFPNLALARCGLADVYALEGRRDKAQEEFERFAANNFATIPRDWNWICCVATLSGVCLFLEDKERAAILYELLRPYGPRNVTIGWGDVSFGSLDHYLGRLAALAGRLDDAEAHFVAALKFNEQMEARPLVARTLLEYATALIARDRGRDRETSQQLLRRTLELASTLGMKDLEESARVLMVEHQAGPVHAEPIGDEPRRAIASVLFTDLVGSTERASELKDRRWVELLQKFYSMQREQVAKFDGRQINTTGDGMFAVFNHPAEAIRCAFAVVASAARLGLQVRSGIHTGECEFIAGDVAGIAVHIGARVAARAEAGEVIVSSTVRDLLAGGHILFNDRGMVSLKGVPGEWRLYAVEQGAAEGS